MTQNTKTKGSTKIAIFCIIMLATASAQAMSIGAGPSDIDFKKMLKSGYGEKTVTVSTAGDEDLTVTVEPTGDIKDWITIKPANTFNLPPKGRFEIKVIVSPPPNAANGDYKGAVYIRAAPTSIVTDGTGSAIGGAIKIGITVSVSGEEVVEYKMQEVRVTDTEVGFPVRFNIAIANTGNVIVTPTLKIEVYDKSKRNLLKTVEYKDLTVLPTKTDSAEISISTSGLEVGKYVADVSSELGGTSTVEFNIWERGTLALKGMLQEITLSKIWVQVDEIVQINALFVNRGELMVEDAKLKGEVYLVSEDFKTEKLVETFESDPMSIPVTREVSLTAYYKPTQPGRYIIRGIIQYGGKKTPSKESILNVLPQEKNYTMYYIGVGVIVILLVYYLLMKTEDGRTRRFKRLWNDYLQIK